jgi:hypothetical protein
MALAAGAFQCSPFTIMLSPAATQKDAQRLL